MTLLVGALLSFAQAGEVGLAEIPPADVRVAPDTSMVIPEVVPIAGPWRLVGSVRGVRSYEARLPLRTRALFFTSAPDGMRLLKDGRSLTYAGLLDNRGTDDTWEISSDGIVVRVAPDEPPPAPDAYRILFPKAVERERSLHASALDSQDPAFVVRSVQVDDTTRRGLYLPTPSDISWQIDVPDGGWLRFDAGILPPELDDRTRSDGANLEIELDHEPAFRVRLEPGPMQTYRVDLARWAGKTARLHIRSSDGQPLRDHVFLAEPVVYVPRPDPKRVVLVFVDTLRRDHLGTYGYERAPAPGLDALAAQSVVFDDARTVAPWTLPSARAALTGQQPEHWASSRTLGERLAAEGWATGALVGNIYLSSNFEMSTGWGEHGCVNWPPADLQVDRGLDFLRRHADQNALLMVHFMDMHLPYKEPPPYWGLYAKETPEGVGMFFTRTMLLRLPRGLRPQLKQYLVDRYDQNLRYVDDAVRRLLRGVGDDATVVFFSDHGEEFFDHGDLEHGHTLYDELLRIPFFIHSPGLEPRRVTDPVSLIDLTPTVLEILGLPIDGLAGRSLLPQARGEVSAPRRPIGFGRVLYGEIAWGSLLAGRKYVSREGAEQLYELDRDPLEEHPLAPYAKLVDTSRDALAEATGFEVRRAWRIVPSGASAPSSALEVRVPGGVEAAWVGDDPTMKSTASLRQRGDESVIAAFSGMYGIQREIFVVPRRPIDEVTPEVTIRLDRPSSLPTPLIWQEPGAEPVELARVTAGGRGYVVTWATVPLPAGEGIDATDPEMNAALRAIGYLGDREDAGSE